MKVTLTDGTAVQARGGSAGIISIEDDREPAFGLYLDSQWSERGVTWPSRVIEWSDFGVPDDEPAFFSAVRDAYARARCGQLVEIACDGGTGRTGTAVACLAILAGVAREDAVQWTRANYHRWAVETPEQEELVKEFGAWLASQLQVDPASLKVEGFTLPPRPATSDQRPANQP